MTARRGSNVPLDPPIFHITHVENLDGIVEAGFLFSDAACRAGSARPRNIGYSHIKERRLRRKVPCAAKGRLGDYVPFNFCPRSVMLYVVANGHDDYRGGQDDIVHLRSKVSTAVALGQPWAFTDRHAEVEHALFFDDLQHLHEIDWSVMPKRFWNNPPEMKEKRQAEFLVHERFAWQAIDEIACIGQEIAERVLRLVGEDGPAVRVRPQWYY